jgi:hypothetical protein
VEELVTHSTKALSAICSIVVSEWPTTHSSRSQYSSYVVDWTSHPQTNFGLYPQQKHCHRPATSRERSCQVAGGMCCEVCRWYLPSRAITEDANEHAGMELRWKTELIRFELTFVHFRDEQHRFFGLTARAEQVDRDEKCAAHVQ